MLGSPAAKRAHAPLLSLPSRPCRTYIRSPRPPPPRSFDGNDDRRVPNRPIRRTPPRTGPPQPAIPGPYGFPPPYYGAPAYADQWQNGPSVPGVWGQSGYYPPHYQSLNPQHLPSGWASGRSAPRRYPRDGLKDRPYVPRSKAAPADFSTVYPSFTYKPPNFENELRIAATPTKLYIQEVGNERVQFRAQATALRDKCNCSKCRDPSSSQKMFRTAEIPLDLSMAHVGADEKGLRITYTGDIPRLEDPDGAHIQVYPWEELVRQQAWTLKKSFNTKGSTFDIMERTGVVHWDREIISNRVRSIDYEDFVKGEDAMWDAVVDLSRYGLVFLRNVPEDPESIKRITTTIAPIQPTFYGETFDVRAKPNAENVAYTSDYLGLHQDLLYLVSTPQIQLLHCLENSCSGGESLFCDGDRIGRLLSLFASESRSVASLANDRIDHGYDANGKWYWRSKPSALCLNNGVYRNIWWSPPFEAPIGQLNASQWTIRGKKLLETLLNEPETVYERKMEPGECVLFDNRRVMHGRNAFDAASGGSRWLRGAYISEEDFHSRAVHMPEGYAEKNRDSIPIDVMGSGLQESLRNTQWYDHVRELIAQDKADADAIAEKLRDDKKFQQQVREKESWAMERDWSS